MARESRGAGGRWLFFVVCLALGVTAVTAVAGLISGIDEGLRGESKQLLAADLVVEGRSAAPPEVETLLTRRPGLELARVRELVTVVAAAATEDMPGRSQLVELKAVESGYPFYGELTLQPVERLATLLGAEGAVVAPDLLLRLGLEVGDTLRIGGEPFRIRGTVASEPDRVGTLFALGPRVFVSAAGLDRTGLDRFGSRIRHRLLVKLPQSATAEEAVGLADEIERLVEEDGTYRVESHAEGQPGIRQGLRRSERFIGLVALLSLLVGGIGVAQTTRAWLAERMDSIAILRCLGFRPREVSLLYAGQVLALACAGSLIGALGGTLVLAAFPRLLAGLLPVAELTVWQPAAALRGVTLGIGIAMLFCLPPLLSAGRVAPVRVFRRDTDPLPVGGWLRATVASLLAGGVWTIAALQSGSWRHGGLFTLGLMGATAALSLVAWGVVRVVRALPRWGRSLSLRYGLAALGRPGASTIGGITALGLGVLVVLGMSLVESQLGRALTRELPADAPSAFLIDIQPSQWEPLRGDLEAQGVGAIESVPVVTARLSAIDGERLADLVDDDSADGGRRWALTREQRLTTLERLPEDNRIVSGALWSAPERAEISVEAEFAQDLGVGVGSVLEFDVQGVDVELEVTSIRTVDWQTFGINFYLVVEPGILDEAPQTRIAAVQLPVGEEQRIQDRLASLYPNVTVFRIRDVLRRVATILGRMGAAVRLLGGFTVLTGIVILAGAISAGSVRRAREVALLKTLGATRRGVTSILATEYALIGLLAGAIGAAGAAVLARYVLIYGMEVEWSFPPTQVGVGVALAVVVTVAAGLLASLPALRRRPLEVLRDE
jgi:putative ABC transport system permease protein